jgi:hypothetical protein
MTSILRSPIDVLSDDDYLLLCELCGIPYDKNKIMCCGCGHTNGICDICEACLEGGQDCLECGSNYPFAE